LERAVEKKPGQLTISVGAVVFGILFGQAASEAMAGTGWIGLGRALLVAMAAGLGVLFFWFILGWRR
jgi:hypothetical protein